jgi:glycosyltransferase involved in cell wall biosynthesis
MRVLFLQETDWVDKTVGQHHHLAEMLSLRGHEVRAIDFDLFWRKKNRKGLLTRREIFPDVSKTHEGGKVTVIRPGIFRAPIFDYISLVILHKREIDRQIKEFAPDVIIGFSILNSYMGRRAAAKKSIPFIYYWIDVLHDIIPLKPFRSFGKMVVKRTLKNSDRILSINEALRDVTVGLGAPPGKSHVVRAGVDYQPLEESVGQRLRSKHGFEREDIVLFFVGWMYHFAGLKEVLLRMAEIENPRLKALIVGEGDAFEDLKRIRREHNLEKRVVFTGKKPYHDIPSFIAAADICLLPAYPEEKIMQDIVPIKIYEYMAMKKPVLVTRLPGVMREFGHGNGVIYVERPEDVVGKALELVESGMVEEEAAKARNFVQDMSWDKITDRFEEILEEAVKEKRG